MNKKWLWFLLRDRADCDTAVRMGAGVGLFTALIYLASVVVATASVEGELRFLAFAFVHVLLLVALSILTFRRSRFGATALLVYAVGSWIVIWDLGGLRGPLWNATAVLVTLTYLSYFAVAVRASFLLHPSHDR